MARYYGRLVGHYTSGGHYDECGHWHPSGFNYSWFGTSVLNEVLGTFAAAAAAAAAATAGVMPNAVYGLFPENP